MLVELDEDVTGQFSGWNVAMAKASCRVSSMDQMRR